MKNYEFNNWIESVKGAFPKFNPSGEIQLAGWKEVLGDATLDEAKAAVVRYVAEVSDRYEPQPKAIAEILKNIRDQRQIAYQSPGEVKPDFPLAKFQNDIALGICRHNLYVYRDAEKLVNRGLTDDFDEALRLACQERTGREYEFPSKNDLAAKGLAGVKADPGQVKMIFNTFVKGW